MYIIPMYLRPTTFTKSLPQMSFHLYFLLFLFRSGAPPMTLLTVGALTDLQLPATASNVCTADGRLGGVGRVASAECPPPPTKTLVMPVYTHATYHMHAFHSLNIHKYCTVFCTGYILIKKNRQHNKTFLCIHFFYFTKMHYILLMYNFD